MSIFYVIYLTYICTFLSSDGITSIESQAADLNILVPVKYYLENEDALSKVPLFYLSFGANVPFTTDQANSLSQAHRDAGTMSVAVPMEYFDDKFWTEEFPKMYDTTDPDSFPGFLGSNHAGAYMRGPLKEDWTKACPLDWTQEERDEKCIPLQEAIYGTKELKRLEMIKEAIDPSYMFDCIGCVGNNRKKTAAEPKKDSDASSASSQALNAAVLLVIIATSVIGSWL